MPKVVDRQVLGPLALQHHGWRDQGYSLDWRTCIMATRVVARDIGEATDDSPAGEGGYDLDNRATGDLTNVFAWAGSLDPEPQGRAIAGFSWAWAAVVVKPKGDTQQNQQTPPPKRDPATEGPTELDSPAPFEGLDPETGNPADFPPKQSEPDAAAGGGPSDATPPMAETKAATFTLLPIRNDRFEPDTTYDPITMTAVAGPNGKELGSKYPVGTRGILLAGSETNEQFAIFFPCDNRLVAVNWAGDPMTGTLVADLNGDGEVADDRMARLNSMMRVIRGPYFPEPDVEADWKAAGGLTRNNNVLAWNLGGAADNGFDQLTGQKDSFSGWLWMGRMAGPQGQGTDLPPGGPHLCREEAKGPFATGCGEKHQLATDMDDNPIYPLHMSIGTLWTKNIPYPTPTAKDSDGQSGINGTCAPILFEGAVHFWQRAPYTVPVHLRYDPQARHSWFDSEREGVWRMQAESFFNEPDQPDTPDNPPPPPPPPWDPDTGQPKYPGKIPPDKPDVVIIDNPDPGMYGLGDSPGEPLDFDRLTPQEIIDLLKQTGGQSTGGDIVPGGTPPQGGDHGGASPGRGRAEGWWGTLRDLDGPPTITPSGGGERDRFAATQIMTAFPGLLFRPQYFSLGAPDMRHWMDPTQPMVRLFDRTAPVVLRLEAYGAQGADPGGPFLTTSTGREYNTLPRTERYPGGSGPGGVVFLSADSDMTLIDQDLVPTTVTPAPGYVVAGPNVYWAAGMPSLADGGVMLGYRWGADENGNLSFDRMDGNGDLEFSLTLPITDGNAGEALLTDGTGGLYFGPVSATMGAIFGGDDVQTIGGTGTETTLLPTGAGTTTIPADNWTEGKSIRTLVRGTITTLGITPGNIQLKGKLDGATNLATGAVNIVAGLNNATWEAELVMTCHDMSTPSAAVFTGSLIFKATGATPVAPYVIGTALWSGVVDTTQDLTVDLTWQWGTSSGGNTITTTVAKMDSETP